jgi:hypothetical protein
MGRSSVSVTPDPRPGSLYAVPMQTGLGDYLGRRAWRLWVVVLVTVLAAGGAFIATHNTKVAYTASVDVTVPAAQSTTASANSQYVENFKVGLTTESVLDQISASTHVSKSDLESGLSATQQGNSSFFIVSYQGSNAAGAEAVTLAAAKATSALLAQPAAKTATTTVTADTATLAAARAELAAADKSLTDYRTANNGQVPTSLYQTQQSLLVQLEVNRQQAVSDGKPTSGFDTAIASAQATLSALSAKVVQYQALTNAQSQAQADLTRAQQNLAAARTTLSLATQLPLIGTATTSTVSASSVIVKAVAISAGVAFVLSVALMIASYALSRRRPVPASGSAPVAEPAQVQP